MRVKSDFYRKAINSSRWRALRHTILMDHPLCADCMVEGAVTPATEIHHVIEVDSAPTPSGKEALMWNPENLVPLCHACHVRAHMALGKQSQAYYKAHADAALNNAVSRFIGPGPEDTICVR